MNPMNNEPVNEERRILLVDDDLVVTGVIGKYLTATGFLVSIAHSGMRALLMAVESAPNVIICDWNLPDMGGREILQLLKQQAATAKVPIIVMTADLMAMSPDAFEILRKPFHPQVLLEAVDRAFEKGKAGG